MARMKILLLGLSVLLVLGACTQQEPEFTEEDQMRAEDLPEDAPEVENDVDAPEGEAEYTWVAVDIDYPESPSEVPTGATVELVNEGGIFHDVVIRETGDEILAADGGASDTATLDLDPGEYEYFCSVPGHEEAGMVGTFTVTE